MTIRWPTSRSWLALSRELWARVQQRKPAAGEDPLRRQRTMMSGFNQLNRAAELVGKYVGGMDVVRDLPGTTGRPKGVLLTHGNVLAGARLVSEAHQLGPADRVLAVLPMYHINAQIVTALAPLWHGGSLVMPQRFSVGAFWPLAAAHACTSCYCILIGTIQ